MPLIRALSVIVTACQQQVDLEGHGVISADEWKGLISRAYGELHTIVFESGLQYFETSAQLVTDGSNVLDEPDDHFSLVTMAYVDASTGRMRDLRPLQPQQRSRWTGRTGGGRAFRYELVARQFLLFPTPPTGQTYELRYVAQPPDLSSAADDTDVDVVTADGLEFLIWSVAVKACGKTEADPQLALRERDDARVRFKNAVAERAFYAPRRQIVDTGDDDEDCDGWPW